MTSTNTKALNNYIDHTNLSAICTKTDIQNLCKEAIENQFYAVCIHPQWVEAAQHFLFNTPIHIATVIDFPFGAESRRTRLGMVTYAVDNGATEVDIVAPLHLIQEENWHALTYDLESMVQRSGPKVTTKAIIEVSLFTAEQIKHATQCCIQAGINFIKTSTGIINTRSTELKDLETIQEVIKAEKSNTQIKISGGIKTREQAIKFITAGASRIGTSSALNLL